MFYENDELLNIVQVIKAFKAGKTVECKFKDGSAWTAVDINLQGGINMFDYDYRIKPEKKKRPMTFEEIVAYWKEHRTEIFTIKFNHNEKTECFINSVDYESKQIIANNYHYDINYVVERFLKEDGSKFEVEE